MAKPFIEINVRKKDEDTGKWEIGESLLEYGLHSLSYERSIEKDNLLILSFTNATDDFLNKSWLKDGKNLVFNYGITDGLPEENVSSGKRYAEIFDLKRTYDGALNKCTIYAKDRGAVMKQIRSNRVWNGTGSQILREIATQFGLNLNIEKETQFVYKNLPQANKTYYDFARFIADSESGGDYICYVDDDEINFQTIDLLAKSRVSYNRKDPETKFISLQINEQRSKESGATFQVKTNTINTAKGENQNEIVDSKKTDNKQNLGKYDMNFQPEKNGIKLNQNDSGKYVNSPTDNPIHARNFANNARKKAELNQITATLTLVLEPKLDINEVISLYGLPVRDVGNYLITSLKDTVTTSGFSQTVAELKRNSRGVPMGYEPSTGKVNKTVGNDTLIKGKPPKIVFFKDGKLKK